MVAIGLHYQQPSIVSDLQEDRLAGIEAAHAQAAREFEDAHSYCDELRALLARRPALVAATPNGDVDGAPKGRRVVEVERMLDRM